MMHIRTGRQGGAYARKRPDTSAKWAVSKQTGLRNRTRERACTAMLVIMKRAVQTFFCLVVVLLMVHTVTPPKFSGWTLVIVRSGATEWSIASTHCPDADTRDVVAVIEQRNHIGDVIQPGEQIWVPTVARHPWHTFHK